MEIRLWAAAYSNIEKRSIFHNNEEHSCLRRLSLPRATSLTPKPMSTSFAYHVVVHALEGHGGWTPTSRFAALVAHVNDGHLPYERHHAAGRARAIEGASEGQIERAVHEFLRADATPCVRVLLSLATPSVVVDGFNAYNASAGIAVKTSVSMPGGGDRAPVMVARREMRVDAADPVPCRVGTLTLFDGLMASAQRNARRGGQSRQPSLSSLAEMLGARGSAAEAALVFEAEGTMPVAELARKLGCHQRSLERKLKEEGLTAEALRQAVRMVRATDRLVSSDSLTTIAMEEGFSDLSHMTRSFKLSAGLPPSALRGLLLADKEAIRLSRAAAKPA